MNQIIKTSILNALLAEGYIVFIVLVIQLVQKTILKAEPQGTILIPMVMLSLFVLSAAIMGYLFLSKPIQLYLDGHKQEAVKQFLTTTAFFALTTSILLVIFLLTM